MMWEIKRLRQSLTFLPSTTGRIELPLIDIGNNEIETAF